MDTSSSSASSPNIVLSVADLDRDWDGLFSTFWDSWKIPLQASGELTFAAIGSGGADEAASFAATKEAYLAEARSNPHQHWLKFEDLDRAAKGPSCIIGGAAWTDYLENPFANTSGTAEARGQADQQPEEEIQLPGPGFERGSEKHELAQQFYRQMWRFRPQMMQRPHSYGQAFWIMPEYRHNRSGMLAMDRWTKHMDDLGLEGYCEGTTLSTAIYLQYGFVLIDYPTMVFRRDNPSEDWKRLVRDLQARPVSIMWRPQRGVYTEGKTVLPWEGRPRLAKL